MPQLNLNFNRYPDSETPQPVGAVRRRGKNESAIETSGAPSCPKRTRDLHQEQTND